MIDDGWEEKKENFEEGASDFPENAAHWTGEKVCPLFFPLCLSSRTEVTNHA